jgi:protein-S-isoprenylcysteine O-methyltransferase Ste14
MTTQTKTASTGTFIFICFITLVIFPALVLGLGGNWLWPEGWLFGLWFSAMVLASMIYGFIKDPALMAERSKSPGSDNQKPWDKYMLTVIYLLALLWLVIMPLDAERFKWSPNFPLWLEGLGGLMLLVALYFIQSATMANTYLSTLVRIQNERKQHVISSGVYGFVRHPLYLGTTLMNFGAALLLGSVAGLAIGLIGTILVIIRILGEEKMLADELEGYEEYKKKVKFRLFPYLW